MTYSGLAHLLSQEQNHLKRWWKMIRYFIRRHLTSSLPSLPLLKSGIHPQFPWDALLLLITCMSHSLDNVFQKLQFPVCATARGSYASGEEAHSSWQSVLTLLVLAALTFAWYICLQCHWVNARAQGQSLT